MEKEPNLLCLLCSPCEDTATRTAISMSMSGFSLSLKLSFPARKEVDFPDYGKTCVHQAIFQRDIFLAAGLLSCTEQAPVLTLQVRGPAGSGQASDSCVAMGSRFFSSEEGKGTPGLGSAVKFPGCCAFLGLLDTLQLSGWDFDIHSGEDTVKD